LNNLLKLEEEAIFILHEVYNNFVNPVLLFSGGKDSTVMIHLAKKAFSPNSIPFKILHIDTGHNFPEALVFRDKIIQEYNLTLIIKSVYESMNFRLLKDFDSKIPSRNKYQSFALLDAIRDFNIDACIGGGRRDEEKARAKERIFSVRDKDGVWNYSSQRPELWDIYNTKMLPNENMRVFPLSNWTEEDIWQYIKQEKITLPELYFSHKRTCLEYDSKLIPFSNFIKIEPTDKIIEKFVRFRTVGDMTCTAAIESFATSVDEIISENINSKFSERGETRIDDKISDTGMEERKIEGYF
jgi:sulfate adenylyltransferase subunit 2